MIRLSVRQVGQYKEAVFDSASTTYTSTLMDIAECERVAENLIGGCIDLVSLDDVQKILYAVIDYIGGKEVPESVLEAMESDNDD